MTAEELKELYVDELKDIYSGETQLVKALPKLAKAASNEDLKAGFEEHLEQTKGHVERLEQIFEQLGESPKGKKCVGMEGLVKEGAEAIDEDYEDDVKDAALIGAAQRVEHYEIAAYGTVRTLAQLLGESEHVSLLEETLEEEKATDEKLTEIAGELTLDATEEEEADQEEESDVQKLRRKKSA
jgi:ferritin-like metal-binding protein YciE